MLGVGLNKSLKGPNNLHLRKFETLPTGHINFFEKLKMQSGRSGSDTVVEVEGTNEPNVKD